MIHIKYLAKCLAVGQCQVNASYHLADFYKFIHQIFTEQLQCAIHFLDIEEKAMKQSKKIPTGTFSK